MSNHVQQLIDKAIELGLNHNFKFVAHLIKKLSNGFEDNSDVQALTTILNRESQNQARSNVVDIIKCCRPQPTDEVSQGEISTNAKVADTNSQFNLSLSQLIRGLMICGVMGFGKTVLMLNVILSLISKGISSIIIDSKGVHDFDLLANTFPNKVLLLKTGRDFFHNPFQFSLEKSIIFAKHLAEITERRDSYILNSEAVHLLHKTTQRTFAEFVKRFPDVKPKDNFKINRNLLASTYSVFKPLLDSPIGNAFDCTTGLDFTSIIKQGITVVIDTSSLTQLEEELLIATIGWHLYHCTSAINDINTIKALLYLDEGAAFVSNKIDKTVRHLSPTSSLVLKARGGNLAIAIGTQCPSDINNTIATASHIKIIGHLLSSSDIRAVQHSCGLNNEQAHALSQLDIGQFLVKLGSGYPNPFIVNATNLEKCILDQATIDASNNAILAKLPPIKRAEAIVESTTNETIEPKKNETKEAPIDQQTIILTDLFEKPFLNLNERVQSLSPLIDDLDWKTLKPILKKLSEEKLLEIVPVRMQRIGNNHDLCLLTPIGAKVINKTLKAKRGGTSYKHHYFQRLNQHLLKQLDIESEIEFTLNGKTTDVSFMYNNMRIAIETPLTTVAEEPEQAEKNLEAGFDKSWVFCINKDILKAVERSFKKSGISNPNFTIIYPWHLKTKSLDHLINYKPLVYKPERKS